MALSYLDQVDTQRNLVVAPLSVLGTWQREIDDCGLDWPTLILGDGSVTQRAKALHDAAQRARVVVVNYDAYWREPMRSALLEWGPEAIVLDEAQRLKHRTAKQAKFGHYLADRAYISSKLRTGKAAEIRLALTGTPITQGPEDLWSIYRFIDRDVFGTRWGDFEHEYCVLGGFQFHQIVAYRNLDKLQRLVAATSYQCSKSEAFDLPDRQDVIVPIELTPKTRKLYDTFRKQYVARLTGGVDEDGHVIEGHVLARIALTAILRLQQIVGGFVAAEKDGNYRTDLHDISHEKLSACQDLVDDALENGQQVVVFTRFRHDIERLVASTPTGRRYGVLWGGQPRAERDAMLQAFKRGDLDVIYSQIRAGSLGINEMVAASVGIFYSIGYELEYFLQARDRLHRKGQTQKVTYYILVGKDTVEEKIVQELQRTVNVASNVINLDYVQKLLAV